MQKSENVSFSVPSPDPVYTSWSMSGQATHSLNAGSIAASATVSSASPGPPDTGGGVNTRTEALVANAGTAGKPPQFWLTGAVSQFQTCSAYIVVSGANYTWIYSAAARTDGTWGYTSSSSQTQANGSGTISGTTILAQPDLSQDGPYTAYVELDVDSSLGARMTALVAIRATQPANSSIRRRLPNPKQ